MATAARPLGAAQRDAWETDGYVLLRGVVAPDLCAGALAAIARTADVSVPLDDLAPADRRVVDAVHWLVDGQPVIVRLGAVVTGSGDRGEPWHRTAHGTARLALTEATLAGACPWVVPGSHTSHAAAAPDPDPFPPVGGAGTDAGTDRHPAGPEPGAGAVPVQLDPGDVLLHHAGLLVRTTDNHSVAACAALLYQVST
jgi:hypothetical protein